MQNTVQMKTHAPQGIKRDAAGKVEKNGQNTEFTDPFLQIIMSLVTQLQDQSQQQDSSSGVTGTISQRELTALFQSSPNGMAALQSLLQSGEPDANAVLNSSDSEKNATALTSFLGKAGATADIPIDVGAATKATPAEQPTDISDLLNQLGKSSGNAGEIAISSDALSQMTDLLGLSSKDEMQALLKSVGIEVKNEGLDSTQSGISQSVVKAKELLSEYLQQQKSGKDEIDVDKLQNGIAKLDTTAPFELRFKTVQQPADSKVLDQITDGIKQNISLGKSEFVIKLKPETLGEITVKLVEEAGKTTLTITTAKAATAKLINNDLGALRDAVAPMKVSVQDAVVSTNETANGSMQQFNMSGQQFAGQQFAGHQSFLQMSQAALGHSDNQTANDIYESSQVAQSKFRSSDRLDAYV